MPKMGSPIARHLWKISRSNRSLSGSVLYEYKLSSRFVPHCLKRVDLFSYLAFLSVVVQLPLFMEVHIICSKFRYSLIVVMD
jgi:hypothetical protein